MSIITTKYRDIPWEEAVKCQPSGRHEFNWEQAMRGKEIRIRVPADSVPADTLICGGPYFVRPLDGGMFCLVCPHIAEIGD